MLHASVCLLLLTTLNRSAASAPTAQKRQDDDCNCEAIGPWQPLFKPSPILHSELPEHRPTHLFDIYSSRADIKLIPHVLVPVVNPVTYTLHHDFGSNAKPPLKYSLLDTSVRESTDAHGKPVIKWEHYGGLKHLSLKYNGGGKKKKNKYRHKDEYGKKTSTEESEPCTKEDDKYFNSESFFDGSIDSQQQLDLSNEFNSKDVTYNDFPKPSSGYFKSKKPPTSFASISSIFSRIKPSYYGSSNVLTHAGEQGRAEYVHTWQNAPKVETKKETAYRVHELQEDMSNNLPKYSQKLEYYPLGKDYDLGEFWKDAKKMEEMSPPPLGQKDTWFVKPRSMSFVRNSLIKRNKPFSYVYIIKSNKDSNPLFI